MAHEPRRSGCYGGDGLIEPLTEKLDLAMICNSVLVWSVDSLVSTACGESEGEGSDSDALGFSGDSGASGDLAASAVSGDFGVSGDLATSAVSVDLDGSAVSGNLADSTGGCGVTGG